MQHISETYQQRAQRFADDAKALRKRYDRYSLFRLLFFFGSLAVIIYAGTVHLGIMSVLILLFLGGFYRLMQWHQQLLSDARHLERMAEISREELGALKHEFTVFPSGAEHLHPDHPYALDLDIFGQYSLFQYTCRATTVIGQERLARYLDAPASVPVVLERQEAMTELKPKLDWRQHFRAYGSEVKDDPRHLDMLNGWLGDANLVRGNRWLIAAMRLAPLWFITCILLWIFFIPWQIFLLLFVIPPAYVLKKTKERVDRTHLRTMYVSDSLAEYARLLKHIEGQDFSSSRLRALKEPLTREGQSAAKQINRLSYIISQLNVRYNFFAIILNLIGLWDLHWVYKLEKWRDGQRENLPVWFEVLREFEALSSLANLWYNNPDWMLPELQENPQLHAEEMGHPLIHQSKRVPNNITMPTRGHIKLVTGSNMAGKSTLLRTVGLNIVLAQSGAPVCARKFILPQLQVYTSMRTVDDLHENTSSFYAELKRLKVIIEAVKRAQTPQLGDLPVFFLLDEILKGTNSVDRHTGSAALIRQLIELKGGGLIATHDLELGRLEAEAGGAVENLCMEVEVSNGELIFDYKLKPGVSQSFNATLLMRQMGIDVKERSREKEG